MGIENLNQSESADGSAAAGAGADDDNLAGALSGDGEGEFIIEGDGAAKKPSPMVMVGLVLAVLGGGYLWYTRMGPASAAAAEATAEDQASQTVSKFLDGGTANVQMMEKMLRDTEKVVQQFLNYPSMKQVPLEALHTNPFRFRALKPDGEVVDAADELAKKKREEQRQAVIKAVATLDLQSVIHSGNRKACMINNAMYTEGQHIGNRAADPDGADDDDDATPSFVIEKINPGSVIVKSGVYRFELRMQK